MKRLSLYISILVFASVSFVSSQSVNVPLEHWAYEFIDRMQMRGLIRNLVLGSRPFSRQDMASMLAEIEQNIQSVQVDLSSTEAALFGQLKGEFRDEMEAMHISADPRWHERHLLTWEEGKSRIYGDAFFDQTLDRRWGGQYDSPENLSHTTVGGIFRGRLGESLGFYVSAWNTLRKGEDSIQEDFDLSQGTPITVSGKHAYSDDASAYLVWQLPWLRLEFGRDRAQWGPGARGSLMLSAQNPRFDLLRLHFRFKRFRFTSIHGELAGGSEAKYFAAHRLEITILPWLILGGSESVVYGGRGIEMAYLNPIMPYHVAEHHLGDKDNNAMGFDITAYPFFNHKCYFELFIDDYTTAENPFTYYGNKFAFLAGWHWTAPLGISNGDLQIEYARVEPYVYTHKDSLNVYKNYNKSIGHWLGPNSDDLFIRAGYLFHRDFRCSITADRIRHGEGDIDTPHNISQGTRKNFLSGTVETRWIWGIEARAQVFKDAFVALQYHFSDIENLNRTSGVSSKEHQLFLRFTLNY